jgi:perosamine synthetase
MSNINAAIGIEQMKKLDAFIRRKREIVIKYDQAFSGMKGIKMLENDYHETAQFCYIIRILNKQRDNLMEYLKQRGIGSGVHYIPNHRQPFFLKYSTSLPVTERLGEEILTLPLYFALLDEEVDLVINSVKEFMRSA